MRRPAIARHWRSRLVGGALLAAIGYVVAVMLDFEPQPAAYVLLAVIVCAMAWLVLDTVDASTARWSTGLPASGDRVDEATSDLRILSSHAQSSAPTPAVRDRLVALARARDPVLAETLLHEIDPVRRLQPAEIDRILTRIEESLDRP